MEDQALVKQGIQKARHYLLNNFGSDITGRYFIDVANNPNDQSQNNFARVNGDVMTMNVGHEFWTGYDQAWRLKALIHETTHFWQQEQGDGPGCEYHRVVGLAGSHDPMTDVLQEGHAEYVGFMAAGLEDEAFALVPENLAIFLSPVNRHLQNAYPVRRAGVYWLIKQKGPMAFSKYCSEVGNGKTFPVAFENGFGMTVEEFTEEFKQYLLGGLYELCSQNSTCDKVKLNIVWQAQESCFAFRTDSLHPPIDFLTIGYPRYLVAIADGKENEVDAGLVLGAWMANQWNEKTWFFENTVSALAFKNLFETKGVESFKNYCNAVAQGAYSQDAFKSSFGLTVQDFRTQFKNEVLGEMADCTVAMCGPGVDNFSEKYKLGHLLDPTRTTPNLIVHFVDQNNKPVVMTHVSMLKQNVGTAGEYAQPFLVPGIFSNAMLPGRYSFFFCEPGFPIDQNDSKCQYHETDWFDVFSDKITELTFQIPLPIENLSVSTPNLTVKFLDKDGNPVPNLILQICSYENPVKICSNPFAPDRKTDSAGVYLDSLRSGKYLIRFSTSADLVGYYPFYEIKDIDISASEATIVNYQFPIPNLVVKFTDANGNPVNYDFVLCKIVEGVGDCSSSANTQSRWGLTNPRGIFEARVKPGQYYILTCKFGCIGWAGIDFDIKITDIFVSETEVTTIEYQLHK